MKDLLPLLDRIKKIRCRTADELPLLCTLGTECLKEIQAVKSKKIVEVGHKESTYLLLQHGNTGRIARPVRKDLFLWNAADVSTLRDEVCAGNWDKAKAIHLERLIYTVQQSVAMYLDLFHPNAAARVVGTVFEAMIAAALNRVTGLAVGSGTVRIDAMNTAIRTDLSLEHESKVLLLAATKTSTRERLSQPFVQKRIVEQVFAKPPRSILLVVGDVQRLGDANVQHTFTAGQFLLYWKYITPLDGVYYIDVPPQASGEAFKGKLKPMSQLFSTDLARLVAVTSNATPGPVEGAVSLE